MVSPRIDEEATERLRREQERRRRAREQATPTAITPPPSGQRTAPPPPATQQDEGRNPVIDAIGDTYQRARQASLGFFTADNPVESVQQAVQGFRSPTVGEGDQRRERFNTSQLGFVRNMEDSPVQDALEFVLGSAVDPITLGTAGFGGFASAGLRALGPAGRAAAGFVEPITSGGSGVLGPAGRFATRLAGETAVDVAAGAAADVAGRVIPEDTPGRGLIQFGAGLAGGAGALKAMGGTARLAPREIATKVERKSGSPAEGMVRLYRAEPASGAPRVSSEVVDAMGGAEARGRWFTQNPNDLRWYVDKSGGARGAAVKFIDIPASQLDTYRVSNVTEEIGGLRPMAFSGDAGMTLNEFFLPRELADRARRFRVAEVKDGLIRLEGFPDDAFKGNLIRTPRADALGDYTVKDALMVANDLRRQEDFVAVTLDSEVEQFARGVGEWYETPDGAMRIRGVQKAGEAADGVATEVLEFPERFNLTPEQRTAVEGLRAVPARVATERGIFNAPPPEAELEIGQNFIPRFAKTDAHGNDLTGKPAGGGARAVPKDKLRTFADPADGIAAGVIYGDPRVAIKQYVRDGLATVARTHEKELLEPFSGSYAKEIEGSPIRAQVQALRAKLGTARTTRDRRAGRAASVEGEARRSRREAAAAAERASRSHARFNERVLSRAEAGDLPAIRSDVSASIEEGRAIARMVGANQRIVAGSKRSLSQEERLLVNAVRQLESVMDDLEGVVEESHRRFGDTPVGELPPINRHEIRVREAEARSLAAKARAIDARINNITDRAVQMSERVEGQVNKGAILRDLDFATREQLLDARKAERVAMETEASLRVAKRDLALAEREGARAGRSATGATGRAERLAGQQDESVQRVADLRRELDDIERSWKLEQQRARQTPSGRRTVETARHLTGLHFDDSSRFLGRSDAARISHYYSQGKVMDNQIGTLIRKLSGLNRALIPFRVILDMSVTLNQLAVLAANRPINFVANFGRALRDASWGQKQYDDYIVREAGDGAAHGLAVLGGGTQRSTDFQFGSWIERVPGLRKAVKPFQRHFMAFGNRMRIDAYNMAVEVGAKRGKPLSDLEKMQEARAWGRLTGIANNRAGDLETMTQLAPNFFRAHLETIWSAATNGTLEGRIARKALGTYVGVALSLAAGQALIEGRDPKEVLSPFDVEALERGELRFNSNWATVRAAGQDISLFGSYDSLARLAFVAGEAAAGAITEQDATRLFDFIGYFASTKGGPVVNLASSLIQGSTFTGDEPLSLEALVNNTVPFTLAGFIDDYREGVGLKTATAGAVINFWGLKSRPVSPTEQRDIAVQGFVSSVLRPAATTDRERERLDAVGSYWDLEPHQQKQFQRQFPEVFERLFADTQRRAGGGDTQALGRVKLEEVEQDRLADEALAVERFKRTGDASGLREQVGQINAEAAARRSQIDLDYQVFKDDGVLPDDPDKAALVRYWDAYDAARLPGGGLDHEVLDELLAALEREPGWPAAYVERNTGIADHHPVVQRMNEYNAYVRESGYWEVSDEVFALVGDGVAQALGREVASYGDLLKLATRARFDGDQQTAVLADRVLSRIQQAVGNQRKLLRWNDPKLDEALLYTGRVNTTLREAPAPADVFGATPAPLP